MWVTVMPLLSFDVPFSIIRYLFEFQEWKTWNLLLQQSSAGGPSVLDSSEISLENGRTSRFPRPELEISFSPLQPNRMALRRQGQSSAVTVKITHSARKRKSEEMDKVRRMQKALILWKTATMHLPLDRQSTAIHVTAMTLWLKIARLCLMMTVSGKLDGTLCNLVEHKQKSSLNWDFYNPQRVREFHPKSF